MTIQETAPPVVEAPPGVPGQAGRRAAWLQTVGIVMVAAVLFAFFAATAPKFASGENIRNILIAMSVLAIISVGETIVMLLRGIDLSVGAVTLISAVVVASLVGKAGLPLVVSVIAAIAVGALVGLLNGVLAAIVRIEPILVTLGTLMVVTGLAQMSLSDSWVQVDDPTLVALSQQDVFGLPLMVLVMLAVYALGALLMARTSFGRTVYEVGGNDRTARLIGVSVPRVQVLAYVIAGVCAAIAGILQAGHLGLVSHNDGQGMEFTAITAVLIGGLSVASGGVGRLEKTLVGALIVGMTVNYLTIKGVPGTFQQAVLGALILVAVLLDRASRRKGA
jgi:ribose transport system permease protein